jgi:hypothetical protein
MCSNLCHCDISGLPVEPEDVRQKWLDLAKNDEMLTKYERCNGDGFFSGCDATGDKVIVMYEGFNTDVMDLYGIQAYKTFSACYDDLREGKRNKEQVPEE